MTLRLSLAALSCLLPLSSRAGVLGPVPTLLPPGADLLAPSSELGFAGQFWSIPRLQWRQTGPVTVQLPVIGGTGAPVPHTVFMTVQNFTADDWAGFSIEIEGPATVADLPLPNLIGLPSFPIPERDLQEIAFEDLDWPAPPVVTDPPSSPVFGNISFSLNVTTPQANEPVRITFRPIAVPEPGTGLLLIGLGAGLGLRRRPARLHRQ